MDGDLVDGVIEREYAAMCGRGHRTYLRLRMADEQRIARCPDCPPEPVDDVLAVAVLRRLRPVV